MAYALTHNGGRSQGQMNFLQIGGDFPFLNLYLNSADFGHLDNSGTVDPMIIDSNGWVTDASVHSGWARLFFIPRPSDRDGYYVLKWDGVGTIGGAWGGTIAATSTFTASFADGVMTVTSNPTNPIRKGMSLTVGGRVGAQLSGTTNGQGTYLIVGFSGTVASGSVTADGGGFTNTVDGKGRVVILPNTNRIHLGVSAGNNVKNIVFCHVDDEARLDAGEVFGVKFMERMREANFGSIRFMDWQSNNQNTMGRWSHRRPETYAHFGGYDFKNPVPTPSQAGLTLSCNAPAGFTRQNREVLCFKTGNITGTNDGSQQYMLTVAGFASAPIYSMSMTPKPVIPSNRTVHIMWVEEFGAYMMQEYGLQNGAPYGLCLRLCAELGAHPYFNLPAFCGDMDFGPDHWGFGLATMIRDFKITNNCGWMIEKIEGPNETWNFAGGFNNVFVAWRSQWLRNSDGNRPYPANSNALTTADGYAISALVKPSATMGAGYIDVTFVEDVPNLLVGARMQPGTSLDANGMSGTNFNDFYAVANNVGGNPKKVIFKADSSNFWSGTYDGTGGYLYPQQYDAHNWYGRVLGRTIQQWHAAYGDGGAGRDTQYQFLIGVQTGYGYGENGGDQVQRFISPHWSMVNGSGIRTCDLATHGCPVNYFNPCDQYTPRETRLAYQWYLSSDPVEKAALVGDYVDSFGDHPSQYAGFAGLVAVWTNWKNYFKSLGLKGMQCYEGGWSPDYISYEGPSDYNTWGPMNNVIGATKAAQAVVSLNRFTLNNQFPGDATSGDPFWVRTGNGCVAGMQVNFFSVLGMTELNSGGAVSSDAGNLTFPGNTHINWGNGNVPLIGQSLSLSLIRNPWPFSTLQKGKLYYVVGRDAGAGWIEISATKGGAPINIPEVIMNNWSGNIWAHAGWRVLSVNDAANTVTLDCDSTSFGTWVASPATPHNQRMVYDRGDIIVNTLRGQSKTCFDSPLYPGEGLQGWLRATYEAYVGLSDATFRAEFPSLFDISTERASEAYNEHDGQIWGVLVNIYENPDPPQWRTIKAFNTFVAPFVATVRSHLRFRLRR